MPALRAGSWAQAPRLATADGVAGTPLATVFGTGDFMAVLSGGMSGSVAPTADAMVTPMPDAPVAGDDAFMTIQGEALILSTAQLLANDTDADGDTLSVLSVSGAVNGSVSLEGGNVTFTPAQGFSGDAGFTYVVQDSTGQSDTGTVTIDVAPIEMAPNQNPEVEPGSQTLVALAGTPLAVTVMATDPEDDPLTFAATGALHGSVTGGEDGSFVYTPEAGFTGEDSFTVTVSDDREGSATQQVTVSVVALDTDPQWQLVTSEGFVGRIGGTGEVYGTAGFENITVLNLPGTITFDPSFNNGVGWLHLPGDAADWSVVRAGSNAVFSDGDTFLVIPVAPGELPLVFDDGVRGFGVADATMVIGDQIIGGVLTPVDAPPFGVVLPPPGDTDAQAALVLRADGEVTAGGKFEVYGTRGSETIALIDGEATFDPSFNAGGDTVQVNEAAQDFTAVRVGSNVLIEGTDTTLTVAFGETPMTLAFDGDERSLFYDAGMAAILIGSQEIDTTPVALSPFA